MLKQLLTFALLLTIASKVQADEIVCAKRHVVEISQLHGRFSFAGEPDPKDAISILLPISCKTHTTLRPSNAEEAVAWIDFALPMDFKLEALQGDYVRVHSYGISVEEDLSRTFYREWQLSNESTLCTSVFSTSPVITKESGCFSKILYHWREQYLEAAKHGK